MSWTKEYEIGDTVIVMEDYYGYKKGDKGVIVKKTPGGYPIVEVKGRLSTSAQAPYVVFDRFGLLVNCKIVSIEEQFKNMKEAGLI